MEFLSGALRVSPGAIIASPILDMLDVEIGSMQVTSHDMARDMSHLTDGGLGFFLHFLRLVRRRCLFDFRD
jgi:hypothetical protein